MNYNKLVKPDTFIGQFLEYCKESETPHAYDFWTALWMLSVAIGRDILVDRPGAPIYLNIYCILVAESGITRKSTAVRRAVKFIRDLCDEKNMLIESKITPEKLEYDLALQSIEHDCARASIAIDELVKFLGREKYVETMPTLLTDLFDCPTVRVGGGTLARGRTTLRNVHINFLSASTPSWLLRAVNPDVIEGGFTSRVIFVVEEKPKRRSAWPTVPSDTLRETIQANLEALARRSKKVEQIGISDGAKRKFEKWYRSREIKRDPFRASFHSREDSHVLRIAALLSVNDNTWEIQNHHIVVAISLVTQAREDGAAIFEGTGTNSKIVLGVDAIRDKLLAAGINGVKQSDLTKALQRYMDATHVRTALDIMHDLDMVQRFDGIQLGRGRPTTMWRAKQSLISPRALDNIIASLEPTG